MTNDLVGIPELFRSIAQTVPSSTTCCIVASDGTRNSYTTTSSTRNGTRILTYKDAWECVKWHEAIIRNAIDKLGGSEKSNKRDDVDDIVIAYLSGNSIDLLFSMIACTSISSSSSSSSKHKTKLVRAALLNTRWTATEMATALKSKGKNPTTILLYDTSHGKVAHNVIQRLASSQGHKYDCIPISKVSLNFLKSPLPEEEGGTSSIPPQPPAPIHEGNVITMIQKMAVDGNSQDAFIVFTSGTTGGSKGVRLSHRSVIIQALAKINKPCSYSTKTIMLASTVPLFHVGGLSSCLAVLFAGGKLFFPPPPSSSGGSSFTPSMVRNSLEYPILPVNTLVVVPAMLATYFSSSAEKKSKTGRVYDHVRLILIGGQSATESMIQNIKLTFPNARIVQTYACTEASSSLTFLHVNNNNNNGGGGGGGNEGLPESTSSALGDCVGISPPHIQLRLYNQKYSSSNEIGGGTVDIASSPNEIGIIATKGPHVMNGYWIRGIGQQPTSYYYDFLETNNSEEVEGGWYKTTDLGSFDSTGRLYFRGRIKDVIRTGGETVFAQEVERVLIKHPSIKACAVFPKQDIKFGEAAACAIILEEKAQQKTTTFSSPSSSLLGKNNDELAAFIKEFCKQHGLATYKRPRYVYLVDTIPQNSSGKILKHKLVESYGKLTRSKL